MSPKGTADKSASASKPVPEQEIDLTVDVATSAKVAQLRAIETDLQSDWASRHLAEIEAPSDGSAPKKFFVTFPYPYMNGRLHLGHCFTSSKAEFAVRYHRMKGEYALFPFGFHCTGMPIRASADKLAAELDHVSAAPAGGGSVKGSKATAKSDASLPSDILRHMEVPEAEIPEFRDPLKWLQYFPPTGRQDLEELGFLIDWRRSFITTEVNPYYDKFIRWQFRILHAKGLVTFGKRPSVYSLKDAQPCMDHDRASGEGVGPQEQTLIKLQLTDAVAVDPKFGEFGLPVFLLAATLRPETMVGQTNYWVKPGVEYDVTRSKDGAELWVCGSCAVRGLAAQELAEGFDRLFAIKSDALIGALVTHPAVSQPIRGLPLPGIHMNKGTGIVTSVPSDAPHDLQGIIDLQKIPELRDRYGVKEEWVKIEPILVLRTEKLGDFAAKTALDELKKSSDKKEDKLDQAKEICYKEGFYHGIMILGPFTGEKVAIAKEKMKDLMVAQGSAIVYWEPEREVISRSGDVCVVVQSDQWYLKYGQGEWKQQVCDHFNSHMEAYHDETREKFRACFEWLVSWPCSRRYGLGTRLPFDESWLIDSLSDSTIYNAYYTIAHLLQGSLDGSVPGLGGLTADQIDDNFFNYVFLRGPLPEGADPAIYERCRREFEFWYPVDCRVSGKDLVTNHLTMYLYNHIACLPEDKWPVGIRANGHLKLNGEKMAKSRGNFLTAIESIHRFSATGLRIGLANSGDGADDANFDVSAVKSAVTRLTAFLEFVKSPPDNLRTEPSGFADELLDARISRAIEETDRAYAQFMFRLGLKASFFELQLWWSEYTALLGDTPICGPLRQRYIEVFVVINTPIIPQFSDYVWRRLLGHSETIVNGPFPTPTPYDPLIFYKERLLTKTADTVRFRVRDLVKKFKGLNTVAVWVKSLFTDKQHKCLDLLREFYDAEKKAFKGEELDAAVNAAMKEGTVLSTATRKEWMPFLQFYRQAVPEFGVFLLEHSPAIDQVAFFRQNEQYFLRLLPGYKAVYFFDVGTTTKEQVPAGLWDEGIVNGAQVYIPTATAAVSA